MDRGPARASRRVGVSDQPRDHARSRGRRRRARDALAWDQIEDVGAHIRAPEPATLYRMHGNLTGAYDISHVAVRNRVVLTNKTPTGLNRGFGGPQMYYALERLMQRVAVELKLDPLDVIRRNLVPSERLPLPHRDRRPARFRRLYAALDIARADGGFAELKARRQQARAQGQLYGIGLTAVVEPSVSNMGYITTVLTAEERRKAGPKNGAQATATVSLDPRGACRCTPPRRRRGRATAPCWRRSSPMRSALRRMTSASSPRSTPRTTLGRSPPATTPVASQRRSAVPRILPR